MRAEHDMSGVTKMVIIRSFQLSIVRAPMMAGTAQASPDINGTTLLPLSPNGRISLSIKKVTRAM
jgi:hypothetical protein